MASYTASLPSADLLRQQALWLAPARARLLRQAGIAHRRSILDLGAGWGMVTTELLRRGGGHVCALDRSAFSLHEIDPHAMLLRVAGCAHALPLSAGHFDLVFSQFTLLWTGRLEETLAEIHRVLKPGGHFCAIEPDYRAFIEYPSATSVADIWLAALERAGAVCDVGRRLPPLLEEKGFDINVRLLDQLHPPSAMRFKMLRELSLTIQESAQLGTAEMADAELSGWQRVSHLPLFLIDAVRR